MTRPARTKGRAPRRPAPRTLLSTAADGLLVVLLLCALAHFCLTTYLEPFYLSAVLSYQPTGSMLPIPMLPALGVCLGAGVLSAAVWSLPRYRWLAVLLLLALAGGLAFHFRELLGQGALALWETLSILFTDATGFPGYFLLEDPLPPALKRQAIQALLAGAAGLYALALGWAVVRIRSFWLTFALTLPWLMPAFLAEIPMDWPALMAVCAGWASMLLSGLSARSNPAGGARVTLLALPACLAVILCVYLVFPREGYVQPAWAVETRDELLALDWFSSDDEPDSSQPSGPGGGSESSTLETEVDLSAAGPRRYTYQAVLEVDSDHPGPMYLRGAVYTSYFNSTWTGPEARELDAALRTDGESGLATAVIRYVGGRGRQLFLPYQPVAVADYLLSLPQLDGTLLLPGPWEEYTVSFLPLEGEPSPVQFSEQPYDSEFLAVPEDTAQMLSAWFDLIQVEMEEEGVAPAGDASGFYAQELNAAARVAQALDWAADYDLNTPAVPKGEDFVTYFLEESGRGYCVHFATAATLLLRLQGIPARYVSGYALTVPEEGTAQVLDANAHAWVEIFLDGYGWYPVEVTPSSPAEEEPEPEPTPSPTPAPSLPPSAQPSPSQPPAATSQPEEGPAARGGGFSPRVLLWLIPLLAVLAIPPLLRALRRKQWERMAASSDRNAAVLEAWGWWGLLARWGGQTDPRALELAQKARFSQHALTEGERDEMLSLLRREINRVEEGLQGWRRPLFRLLFPPPGQTPS